MRRIQWLLFAVAAAVSAASDLVLDSSRKEKTSQLALDIQTGLEFSPQSSVSVFGKMVDHGVAPKRKKPEKNPYVKEDQDEDESQKGPALDDKNGSLSFLTIERSLTNVTKETGDTVRMKCEVKGQPAPEIQWFKNEAPLEPERGKIEVRKYISESGNVGSRLKMTRVDIHDMGYYRCEATNGRHSVETTGVLVVKAGRMDSPSIIPNFPPAFPHFPALGGRLPDFEQSDLGFCQHYRGVACSQLIGNKTVYVKATMTLNQMEEKLSAIFTILATGKMSPECHKYAVPFFCYVLFPPCDETLPYPVPRHVCRDDCDTLEGSTCRQEMTSARKHPLLANQDLVPDCEELPSPTVHQEALVSAKDGNCIVLGVPRVVLVNHEETCYRERGAGYRGPVAKTLSSHKCQAWTPVADYRELSGGHNYCRNPGGLETGPWCFISDPHMRREVCDVPRCAEYSWLYIFLPSLVVAALIALLMVLWCKRQRRKSCPSKLLSPHHNYPSAQLIPTHHLGGTATSLSQQQQIEMQKFLPRLPLGIHEVSPQAVRFLQELGDGIYGKVFRGEMHHPRTASGTAVVSPVAIKTLKQSCSAQVRQDFCREVETVSALQHPNVVCLVAVCAREEPMSMLFEYMFQCDLHEFLLTHSPHSDVSARDEDGTPQILELPDFLVMSMQIASGMEYLSSKRYVHRDLAARNCLVSPQQPPTQSLSQTCLASGAPLMDNILVKISDLGVSRHSCASEYFRVRNTLLPVRWMAPESLLYGSFSPESDVWSFGVLLWEIFSYGTRPYFNFDHQEVIDLVCAHQLLPRPDSCPPYVYAVMNDCWHDSPSHRPSFKEVFNRLCSVQAQQLPQQHGRTFSASHSVLTHGSSSHQSSTGPSNKTLSTNLSLGGLGSVVGLPIMRQQNNVFPFCPGSLPFAAITTKMVAGHRNHQCEQV